MKRLNIIFTILLLFAIVKSFSMGGSQTESTKSDNQQSVISNALGFGAGYTTGYGLAYKLTIKNQFCIQVAAAPYQGRNETRYSLGVSFMYILDKTNNMSFYIYQGNHYFHEEHHYDYWGPEGRKSWNNGVGLGFEIFYNSNISFNIMSGYAFYDNFEMLTLTGELALFYNF